MKKAFVTVFGLLACTFALLGMTSPASATSITFSTTGGPEHIFFEGTDHSVTVQYAGSASLPSDPNPIELEIGIPLTDVFMNRANFTTGDWPGISLSETQTLIQTITVGTVSAQLIQDVKVDWIANNQAMVTFFPSGTAVLDLGSVGILDVALQSQLVQIQANQSGQGQLIAATFLLTASAESIVESLIEDVESLREAGVLNGGQANSLTVKLDHILLRLASDRINAACNQLEAFLGQVSDLIVEGVLTPEQGQPLIDATTNARALLDCTPLE